MESHLLLDLVSFCLGDLEVDRSEDLNTFLLCIDYLDKNKGQIYNNPQMYEENFEHLLFSKLNTNDLSQWLQPYKTILIRFWTKKYSFYFTPKQSKSIEDLREEFPKNHTNSIGLGPSSSCIYSILSFLESEYLFLIRNLSFIKWEDEIFLPNIKYSNQLIIKKIKEVEKENEDLSFKNDQEMLDYYNQEHLRTMGSKEKQAFIKEFEGHLLRCNFYSEDLSLGSAEQKRVKSLRKIYRPLRADINYILSLDFENGLIEVCDRKGNHLCAINFMNITKENSKNDHGIKTLQKK